jgi:hypothetical protein
MQKSPPPGMPPSATASVAQNNGSRPAWDIMLPIQFSAGSTAWS